MKWGKRNFVALLSIIFCGDVMGQEANENKSYEEVVVVGTRSAQPRSTTETLAPVDIISEEDFHTVGGTADVTDNLNRLIPSFMAAPRNGDNNAFQRSVSLRGMAADQTLIMVNGKRRHRSNAINIFGPIANTGSHGVDASMIPAMAIKNVQVLRDGASAQYGSDAIAGVVNFELKDAAKGATIETSFGNHFEGEMSWKVAGNVGMALGKKGFANLTFESDGQEALSRGGQRKKAQKLIDEGVLGVGADSPFGDEPLTHTWGRPESSAHKFAWNAGHELGEMDFYLFGNYAMKDGKTRFFYRPLGHRWSPTFDFDRSGSFEDHENDGLGANGKFQHANNLDDIIRVGFTPYYGSEQTDMSLVTGLQGRLGETNWDFSLGMGSNKAEYTLYNSLNPDADLVDGVSQRDFKTGDYEQREMGFNLDLNRELGTTMFLAYGFEFRNETFVQSEGEVASHIGMGSSGLKGTIPENAGDYSRSSYGAYADMEHSLSDRMALQYALRFENYDDFGGTFNYKLAARYGLSDKLALRGSLNTGFHAPTPGQANLRTQSTSFRDSDSADWAVGDQFDINHIPADSDEAKELGGKALREERSFNRTVGLVYNFGGNFFLTADYYHIKVENKIFKTTIDVNEANIDDPISFYTNALDVSHSGFDLVLMGNLMDHVGLDMDMSLAVNTNVINVLENREVNGKQIVSDAAARHIENDYPTTNFVAMANTRFLGRWNLMTRWRYIGKHYDQGASSGSTPLDDAVEIDPISYVDLELGYRPMKNLRVALGGNNVLDSYPTKLKADDEGFYSGGTVYPRRSAANYDGGSWYVKGTYMF